MAESSGDFFSAYLSYSSDTEVPTGFHRWSIITALGAYLGRQFYLQHGSFRIHTNMYSMLIGSPGTRKSTAIKLAKKLITEAGYLTIAASKTSKEKFLMDLAGDLGLDAPGGKDAEAFLDQNLWGSSDNQSPAEMFIMADEFNVFMGHGNVEFISMLGDLWDYDGVYENRIKSGKSLKINNPTVSILGGNTPTGFSQAFPTEMLGQGFFSRLMMIYGEPNGRRIPFPVNPDSEATAAIISYLRNIKSHVFGSASLTASARGQLEAIYRSNPRINDIRFESYSNRRFNHLIKLCLICAASRISNEIDIRDVTYANTILKHAEHSMPRALGEFGKSRNADVSHKIIQLAESSDQVITYKDIWKHIGADLEKMTDLATLLQNLVGADKLQQMPDGSGFLPKKLVVDYSTDPYVDFNLLTNEERKSVGL